MKSLSHLACHARAFAFALLACTSVVSAAEPYPDQPIRILVPFTPGGGTDFTSRIVGAKLAELTGWQIVIENRPGAGGNLAVNRVLQSPDVIAKLNASGVNAAGGTSKEFAEFVAREYAMYGKLVKASGIKLD